MKDSEAQDTKAAGRPQLKLIVNRPLRLRKDTEDLDSLFTPPEFSSWITDDTLWLKIMARYSRIND